MPERPIRALISLAAVIVLAWIGAALYAALHNTRLVIPVEILVGLSIAGVIAYAIYHAKGSRREQIDRSARIAPRTTK